MNHETSYLSKLELDEGLLDFIQHTALQTKWDSHIEHRSANSFLLLSLVDLIFYMRLSNCLNTTTDPMKYINLLSKDFFVFFVTPYKMVFIFSARVLILLFQVQLY